MLAAPDAARSDSLSHPDPANLRKQEIVLFVDVPAEIQLESGKRIEQRAVGAAYRPPRVVVAGQRAQRTQSVIDADVVALVRRKQCLVDRPALPLERYACGEEQLLFATQVRLQLRPELVEASLQTADLGVIVAVGAHDGIE